MSFPPRATEVPSATADHRFTLQRHPVSHRGVKPSGFPGLLHVGSVQVTKPTVFFVAARQPAFSSFEPFSARGSAEGWATGKFQ